jgi:hypothetical protein
MTLEEEEDDSEDDDAKSRYDTMTFLMHIPDVRSLQGLVSGGRPPRHRGQPRRPSRGRRSERKGGPVRGPWIGGPPSRGLP